MLKWEEAFVEWLLVSFVVVLLMILMYSCIANDPLKSIPGPKPYPFIGNVFEMFQIEAVDLFLQWCQQYGKILKYSVFLLGTQVMVSDADVLQHILVKNHSNYKKPESLLIPVRKIFGSRCLICLPAEEHAARRRILNPAFNTVSTHSKVISINDNTMRLVSTWLTQMQRSNGMSSIIRVQDDLARLSLDILGDAVFGYNFNCIENPGNALTAALYRLMSVQDMNVMRFLPFYKYLPTRMNNDLNLIRTLVQSIIKNKECTISGEDQTDMLDLMVQSRRMSGRSGTQMTDDDIIDDIILFLIAGHETSTNVLCWTLLELARHPGIQERCRTEVQELTTNVPLNYQSANRLNYVECCLKEALRLYPPVPLTLRQAIDDDTLGGYHIPAGTVVALQVAATMRHEDYYENGSTFNPDRFMSPQEYPHRFVPFLLGPERCIGMKFAMLEMKIILASILLNVEFSLADGTEHLFHGRQGLTYHTDPPLYLVGKPVLQ